MTYLRNDVIECNQSRNRDNHLDIASFREEEKVSIMELKQREFSINKCDDSIKVYY